MGEGGPQVGCPISWPLPWPSQAELAAPASSLACSLVVPISSFAGGTLIKLKFLLSLGGQGPHLIHLCISKTEYSICYI